MQIARRFLKYLPRNTTFNLNSLFSTPPDAVAPNTVALNRRSLSLTSRFSNHNQKMATLLWGYLRMPFILASSLGFVLSSGLIYFQKLVSLPDRLPTMI